MKNVLVLCTGNSCRSQMAHGYLNYFAKNRVKIYSAGFETHGVNSDAIKFMKEDGIDISNHTSNNVLEYENIDFDYVITVCDNAKEVCPYFPAKVKMIHHSFIDPSKVHGTDDEIAKAYRKIRGEIKIFCKNFILNIGIK